MRKIIVKHEKNQHFTAILENDRLVELIVDDSEDESLIGNIYMGIIKKILPAGFAFVDIGKEKMAFLQLVDRREWLFWEDDRLLIKQGDSILVQVIKDEVGQKGPTISGLLTFSGKLLVIEKHRDAGNIGVSRKITDVKERARLSEIVKSELPDGINAIIRTRAAGAKKEEIIDEMTRLMNHMNTSDAHWQYIAAPALIHKEATGLSRTLEEIGANESELIYDDNGSINLFDKLGIITEINQATSKKIWLKSGAFLTIEETEACVVIDVNSGKFIGSRNAEKSILSINLEAAEEIAMQIRLRNLSGIIIIDFIRTKDAENTKILLKYMEDMLKKDRISVYLMGITAAGLVEITRKRLRKPLSAALGSCGFIS
ncbi:MAG: ribonuclease E/G [Defluviitaleaceae bacterium]|nr:ribonuclease E/G [Defluviitaleaceae bacterium]